MSYQEKDESVESALPILLFEFITGSSVHRLTDRRPGITKTVGATSRFWSPGVIVPSTFGQANDVNKSTLSIKIEKGLALATDFLDYAPDAVTNVSVFRAMTDEPDPLLYWSGHVADTDTDDEGVTFECVPVQTKLKIVGLRALHMSTCRHLLYDEMWCGLSANDFDVTQHVWEVNGNTVRVNAFSARSGYWVGGTLKTAEGVERTILDHKISQDGDILTLSRPIRSIAVWLASNPGQGLPITLYLGCDHSYAACKARNNKGHFGGWPWFRRRNPFTVSIIT